MSDFLKEKLITLKKKNYLPHHILERIFYKAILIRTVEEALLEAYKNNKLTGTIHTCIGQELVGAIVSDFLENGDTIFSNHRCHGHFLSFVEDVRGLIAEIFGKATGVCGGIGGSQHLCKNGFYSNGVQGGIVPIAAGLALSHKLNKNNNISVVYIGDGTFGEGILYETLNIASKWSLPLLIVLENNLYSQSTHQSETMAGDIKSRVSAFKINYNKGNTWDWQKLYFLTKDLVGYVRKKRKPGFLQIDTYRLKAHSKGDDNRKKEEVAFYESIDPINLLALKNKGSQYFFLRNKAGEVVEKNLMIVDSDPYPTLQHTFLGETSIIQPRKVIANSNKRLSQVINEAFKQIMSSNPKVLFIGEDVKSPYGGAFKISEGLSDLFSSQVFNTPISEAAIIGLGCGLAMQGYYPFIEIMFGDFITLGLDQILNHASKFKHIYNNQVSVPLVIRTPMGGYRGYGPTHSQTLDRHLLGIPGLKVFAINNLLDPGCIYETLINSNSDPCVIIENKVLYTKYLRDMPPLGFYYEFFSRNYPTVVVVPESKEIDITIIGYGGLSDMLLNVIDKLFEEHEIIAQFICPIQIYPYDASFLKNYIIKGKMLFLVEEGQEFANFSAELIAQLVETVGDSLPSIRRIGPACMSIPASKHLEDALLPSMESTIELILGAYYERSHVYT